MKNKKLNQAFKNNKKTFEWCRYQWEGCMEGGRIISPSLPWYWLDKEQVLIDESSSEKPIYLYLTEKNNTVKHWDGNTYYPTQACGAIRSVNSFSYGTFSMDVKAPKGYNLWPSFWLSGDENWPPEIDIMDKEIPGHFLFPWRQETGADGYVFTNACGNFIPKPGKKYPVFLCLGNLFNIRSVHMNHHGYYTIAFPDCKEVFLVYAAVFRYNIRLESR